MYPHLPPTYSSSYTDDIHYSSPYTQEQCPPPPPPDLHIHTDLQSTPSYPSSATSYPSSATPPSASTEYTYEEQYQDPDAPDVHWQDQAYQGTTDQWSSAYHQTYYQDATPPPPPPPPHTHSYPQASYEQQHYPAEQAPYEGEGVYAAQEYAQEYASHDHDHPQDNGQIFTDPLVPHQEPYYEPYQDQSPQSDNSYHHHYAEPAWPTPAEVLPTYPTDPAPAPAPWVPPQEQYDLHHPVPERPYSSPQPDFGHPHSPPREVLLPEPRPIAQPRLAEPIPRISRAHSPPPRPDTPPVEEEPLPCPPVVPSQSHLARRNRRSTTDASQSQSQPFRPFHPYPAHHRSPTPLIHYHDGLAGGSMPPPPVFGLFGSYPLSRGPREQPLPGPTCAPATSSSVMRLVLTPPFKRAAPPPPPQPPAAPTKRPRMACFFCRKRKIACGPGPAAVRTVNGGKDKSCFEDDGPCNQCARRGLECERPTESKRGVRKGKGKGKDGEKGENPRPVASGSNVTLELSPRPRIPAPASAGYDEDDCDGDGDGDEEYDDEEYDDDEETTPDGHG